MNELDRLAVIAAIIYAGGDGSAEKQPAYAPDRAVAVAKAIIKAAEQSLKPEQEMLKKAGAGILRTGSQVPQDRHQEER